VVAELRPTGPVRQPGERVDQGGLPGPVRADEEVEPALEERDVDALDRLEAVEVDGQIADLEVVLADERDRHRAASTRRDTSDFSFGYSEVMPNGRKSRTTMNNPPWK
jgi:hypothetical protein